MKPLTWRAAITGGAIVGLGVGGFAVADDGPGLQPPDGLKLRQTSADIESLSAPVTIAPTTTSAPVGVSPDVAPPVAPPTTVAPAPAPAPPVYDSPDSWDSPAAPPAPAPDSSGGWSGGSSS